MTHPRLHSHKRDLCMAFKLTVFIAILIAIAVLGVRAYAASVRGFEASRGARAAVEASADQTLEQ